MLSQEMNERLTRVGPGTPAGELLRRYWQPIMVAKELTDERPTKLVKIMGESLVIFRDGSGRYGCLASRCNHRGASLKYGYVEDDGLRCSYHGWKFGIDGQCMEQPFEPKGSTYRERVRQGSYPVERLGGLLFVYMGPGPAPLVPRWDVLVREDGAHKLKVHPVLRCNWLQAQENSVDTVHTYYLHGHRMKSQGRKGAEYHLRKIERYEFERNEWGILKRRYYEGESPSGERGHPAVFPNMLRLPEGPGQVMHWRVPIDDASTQIFWAGLLPGHEAGDTLEDPPVEYVASLLDEEGDYDLSSFASQDKMAWETQGAIYDRTEEHLGASDRGIAMWRKLMLEQMEVLEKGGDPMALVRNPEDNHIITFDVTPDKARKEFVTAAQDVWEKSFGGKLREG